MSARFRHYLFGVIFIVIAIIQLIRKEYLEFSLYAVAGVTFIVNTLTSEAKLYHIKKQLVILTWILMVVTGILFLYLLQAEYL
ncbi:hypothetical protein [Chryseosolibacter indicus]|uniref:Uncharacterized protein n=1 Tax=Chryseosolibacter indicus TaxID=2782351 RepID=A0ABS5VUB3_9BACT|nr:hypothetical protein [Chryseosolibacter indicus]MBT1703576.1 hypothetical protein [Chryseosolibacter indicus]